MLLCGLPSRGRGVFSTGGESLCYLWNLKMQFGLLHKRGVTGEEGEILVFLPRGEKEGSVEATGGSFLPHFLCFPPFSAPWRVHTPLQSLPSTASLLQGTAHRITESLGLNETSKTT